ncbi:hypothetical protein QJS04_geneDACA014193 [Acorus gramineus]|uniref:2-(3-amino-3-carboxypropyl)histidine synthase subunit 2 n=1 Tax=Acorus gramineus TaxID=55184 RepID=A0AAV9B6G8_ACOGR|nr:hypothetical protein QJS04_geneDACA014193 [Acorus gramineus]
MDFDSNYEIATTVDYILNRGFTRIALQFPDELLKDSRRVVRALKDELRRRLRSPSETARSDGLGGVRLFVMADTAYGSCCVDEVGASHVTADCVVHYGHACMSPTSTLPALFIFGKASVNIDACAESLASCCSTSVMPILVLFGLEYAHAMQDLKDKLMLRSSHSCDSNSAVHYAYIPCSSMEPSENVDFDRRPTDSHNSATDDVTSNGNSESDHRQMIQATVNYKYRLGGLTWNLANGQKMEDYLLFYIGSDNSAFANVVLTFNSCELVRYDAVGSCLVKESTHHKRILKRRYYLVEKAKDANIVGILVGTLGAAGYLHMIHQIKELIEAAGKKVYTLVMGRPNPAKLANFPECDVFVYVSCAQTALLDSKEFLAPIITPYEAMLAFTGGSQWTGEYVMDFRDLIASSSLKLENTNEGARFSFLQGGYVECINLEENQEQKERSLVLAEATKLALSLDKNCTDSILFKGAATTGAEFLAARTYQGLDMPIENNSPQPFLIGRTGKASGYEREGRKKET